MDLTELSFDITLGAIKRWEAQTKRDFWAVWLTPLAMGAQMADLFPSTDSILGFLHCCCMDAEQRKANPLAKLAEALTPKDVGHVLRRLSEALSDFFPKHRPETEEEIRATAAEMIEKQPALAAAVAEMLTSPPSPGVGDSSGDSAEPSE